jgi:FkbM family methyltransferase
MLPKLKFEKYYKKFYIEPHNIYVRIKSENYSFIYRSSDYDDLNMMCRENLAFWESKSRKIFSQLSKTSNVIFDIGSYSGIYTLLSAKSNEDVKTYSFEPNPELFKVLSKNIKLNRLKNSKILELALGENEGNETLYINHERFSSSASLKKNSNEGASFKVKKITLDSFVTQEKITTIDLMKIDVEEYEINVLRGASESLSNFHPIILMESLSQDSLSEQKSFLTKFGYQNPIQIQGDGYDLNNWLWFAEKDTFRVKSVLDFPII